MQANIMNQHQINKTVMTSVLASQVVKESYSLQ